MMADAVSTFSFVLQERIEQPWTTADDNPM
jgi:hypothetical protein